MTLLASDCQPVRRALIVGVLATLTLVSTLGLTGCAGMLPPDPGAPQAEVATRMGRPLSVSPLPQGGERWLYSTLPMGREVYHFDFDSAGKLISRMQVLDFQHLSHTPRGWTREQVLAYYGPPFEITEVYSFRGKVWSYRFMDDFSLRRLAHIHIDEAGHVAKVMFTDEPTANDRQLL